MNTCDNKEGLLISGSKSQTEKIFDDLACMTRAVGWPTFDREVVQRSPRIAQLLAERLRRFLDQQQK